MSFLMQNNRIIAAASAFLLLTFFKVCLAQSPAVVITNDAPTILRSGPGEDFDRIAELPKGLPLGVDGIKNHWTHVRLSKTLSGWIDGKSLIDATAGISPSHPTLRYIKIKHEKDNVRMEILESEPGVVLSQEWLRPPVLWLKFENTQSALSQIEYDPKDPLILHVSVWQEFEDVAFMRIDLKAFYGFQMIQKDPEHLIVKFKLKEPGASLKGWTICLDPGHGGKDTGAIGPSGLKEKDVVLDISNLLANHLAARGAKVILTRTHDISLADPNAPPPEELEKRVDIAREHGANLFISIHCNARPTPEEGRRARGSFVYYYQPQSEALASSISKKLEARIEEPKYGIVYRSFHVIRETDLPAVLVETVFISNPATEAKLRSTGFQRKIARGILEGILDYAR